MWDWVIEESPKRAGLEEASDGHLSRQEILPDPEDLEQGKISKAKVETHMTKNQD